ncbi:threonine--tRNA ligase [Marinicauda pacifica]|uniref:Threonine--tRNA ligase n=1 Tax=Marinicauda pacifica TaxID=1133559 RepID=A0A4V6RF81_9PROT|nr:threonine--tRNA ligase [Marinicauda pacifica]TGY92229.1 threonine--tRNA ligase [Marinicauda pacifica]GGE47132.1 threonine--tRNA ligase [Marinicauda pacifica]
MSQASFPIDTKRHSAAHLMAAAVKDIWPNARFGVGPATATGFFYDIALDETLTPDDLQTIEKRMKEMRKKKLPFERVDLPVEQAIGYMKEQGQDFKVELLELLRDKGSTAIAKETGDESVVEEGVDTVSFFKTGDFVDLCRGPHVDNSAQIGHFKLRSIAGAYWRGNAENDQLQRIHALCFDTKEELEAELHRLEEQAKRDHRKIGKELGIYTIVDEVGAGLPLWLPNGNVLRDELERLARVKEHQAGYKRVSTPHITKGDLYVRSGHLPYYADDMYAPMIIDEQEYYLRPMNCPHHHMIYAHDQWSYRDLPVRLSEYGQVYRHEASGGLSGLMRVRGFCQNDAHIYCREDQAKQEFLDVMDMHAMYYGMFGIEDFWMRVSLPDFENLDKYVDDVDGWKRAMAILKSAMDESGYPYEEVEGEAAFYGPKVDFMIKSVVGTEYTISTNQLDFMATKRFELEYTSEDGSKQPVYVIHRAPLGSHERFVGFLIEHYAGKFPTWLAPVQAMVIPIADRHEDYARKVRDQLFSAPVDTVNGGIRVEADLAAERMQKKIRNAQTRQIPYMLVVGDAEAEAGTVALRHRDHGDLGSIPVEALIERIATEVRTRADAPKPDAA